MFHVLAGKYDCDQHDRVCEFSDEFETLDEALVVYDKLSGYPWSFIEFKGRYLEAFSKGFEMFSAKNTDDNYVLAP